MIKKRSRDVEPKTDFEGALSVEMRMLIGDKENAGNFHMRVFNVKKQGHTPFHTHPFEHEVYILQGKGRVKRSNGHEEFEAEDAIFIPANEPHQFIADTDIQFICVVPTEKHFDTAG